MAKKYECRTPTKYRIPVLRAPLQGARTNEFSMNFFTMSHHVTSDQQFYPPNAFCDTLASMDKPTPMSLHSLNSPDPRLSATRALGKNAAAADVKAASRGPAVTAMRLCTSCKRRVPSTQVFKMCEQCRVKGRLHWAKGVARKKEKARMTKEDGEGNDYEGGVRGEGWQQISERLKSEFENSKGKGKVIVKNTAPIVPAVRSYFYLDLTGGSPITDRNVPPPPSQTQPNIKRQRSYTRLSHHLLPNLCSYLSHSAGPILSWLPPPRLSRSQNVLSLLRRS